MESVEVGQEHGKWTKWHPDITLGVNRHFYYIHRSWPMDGENQQLVTDELVELKNNWFKFKTSPIHVEEFIEYSSN